MHTCHTLLYHTLKKFEDCWIFFNHNMCSISSIIQNHVRLPRFRTDSFINTPPEILLSLPPPGKNWDAGLCERSRHLVLCTVNITSCPTNLGSQLYQSFYEHSCLCIYMCTANNPGSFQWFVLLCLLSKCHYAWHLLLRNLYFTSSIIV